MPVTKHLNRLDITDFTKGLWDEVGSSTLLTPQDGLAVLEDYEPKPTGGLRAFFKGTDLTTSGITNAASDVCTGIYARGNVDGTASTDFDQIVTAINPSTKKATIWRMKSQDGETTWSNVYTDATGGSDAAFEETQFVQFTPDADGLVHYVISLKGGGDPGVYGLTYSASSATKYLAYYGPLAVSQARVMYCHNERIYYSDVGKLTITDATYPTGQVIAVNPNQPGSIIGMISERAPADLLVGMWAAPWYEIQGDISSSSTPIRALGDEHHQRVHYQTPSRAPGGGIVFIEPGGRIYQTEGLNFRSISDAILRFDVNAGGSALAFGPGRLAVLNDYLFAPGGYVMDFRTGAWLKSSIMPAVTFCHATQTGRVYMANASVGMDLAYMRVFDSADGSVDRCSSGIIQTSPYYDTEGRNVRIREVQLQVQCYTSSGFVVKIINSVGATVSTDTVTGVTGRGQVTFRFPNVEDEYLSVRIEPSATNGTSEAPTIERLSVFFGPNNLISNAAA